MCAQRDACINMCAQGSTDMLMDMSVSMRPVYVHAFVYVYALLHIDLLVHTCLCTCKHTSTHIHSHVALAGCYSPDSHFPEKQMVGGYRRVPTKAVLAPWDKGKTWAWLKPAAGQEFMPLSATALVSSAAHCPGAKRWGISAWCAAH